MKRVCMIQIGPSNNALISNLISTLNSIQSEFQFSFDTSEDLIPYPDGLCQQVQPAVLEKMIQGHMIKKFSGEHAIGICDCALEENVLTSSDNHKALITTYGWGLGPPKYPMDKIIAYGMVDILLEFLNVPTPTHSDKRPCPMDGTYAEKSALLKKIIAADFCPDCTALVRRAVADTLITNPQIVAIYKILDYIADRKQCFVLMPFAEEFKNVYQHIQTALDPKRWRCRRADEINQPSEILAIIQEQILRADLIIADLTKKNPNVFYELGFAHALNKKAILITQSIKDAPFDLRHRQLVEYKNTSEGLENLKQRISSYA